MRLPSADVLHPAQHVIVSLILRPLRTPLKTSEHWQRTRCHLLLAQHIYTLSNRLTHAPIPSSNTFSKLHITSITRMPPSYSSLPSLISLLISQSTSLNLMEYDVTRMTKTIHNFYISILQFEFLYPYSSVHYMFIHSIT